jgi:hypothetical protein
MLNFSVSQDMLHKVPKLEALLLEKVILFCPLCRFSFCWRKWCLFL